MVNVSADLDSILIGSQLAGSVLYRAEHRPKGRRWVRFEIAPDGSLQNEVAIFGGERQQNWRGLPEFE